MKAPALACLGQPARMHPATPDKVTLTGFVHPFSGGNSNDPVVIQVFRASDLANGGDPASITPITSATVGFDPTTAKDASQFRACDADPHIGCVAVDPAACVQPVCQDGLNGRPDLKEYCRAGGVCSQRKRWEPRYTLMNIPTNTGLVMRTYGANGPDQWSTLVEWNIFLASDDKSCGGDPLAVNCLDTSDAAHPTYQRNANVLSAADYVNIPVTVGLSSGITPGKGAIAGEVHDCDDVRIENAQVGVNPAGDKFTYFNGDPYNTLPDSTRAATGTDRLGLFAALNMTTGHVEVQAVGLVNGKETSLGTFKAFVYSGAVSVINVNGGKPPQ
jgi:hypothetical protein